VEAVEVVAAAAGENEKRICKTHICPPAPTLSTRAIYRVALPQTNTLLEPLLCGQQGAVAIIKNSLISRQARRRQQPRPVPRGATVFAPLRVTIALADCVPRRRAFLSFQLVACVQLVLHTRFGAWGAVDHSGVAAATQDTPRKPSDQPRKPRPNARLRGEINKKH
jgi:hypothetical protein